MASITEKPRTPAHAGQENFHAPYRLVEEILARSVANTWHEARCEWVLSYIYFSDEPGTCLCDHYPIREHCIIANAESGNEAVVGNCCVRSFIGLSAESIFAGLRRIARDTARAMGLAAINFARSKNWITDWEHQFLLETSRKRKLSSRQRAKRCEINEKVLGRVRAQTADEAEGRYA